MIPTIVAAGRTDAGVHAVGQVAHCDLTTFWNPFRLSEALNFHLKPRPISIVSCVLVDDNWHARFSALERQYEFRIVCRRAPLTHESGLAWHIKHSLDVTAMQKGADYLLGKHDFTTFRSSICQASSPVKTLDELSVKEIALHNGSEIRFIVRARSFLHNQVRSFVGTLGQGPSPGPGPGPGALFRPWPPPSRNSGGSACRAMVKLKWSVI